MITQERLEQILQEEIAKAKAVGVDIVSISPNIETPRAKSFYGDCYKIKTVYNGKSYDARVRISYYYLNAPEDKIRQTIMHEVLHAEKGSNGHGAQWKAAAQKVNNAYGYSISRLQTTGWSLREEADRLAKKKDPNYDTHRYCVECPSCHTKWYYPTMRKIVREPDKWYCRKCNVSLVRVK